MKVKEIWTEADFEDMCWNDSTILSIQFPSEDCDLKLDMDYIFEWVYEGDNKICSTWNGPCSLTFKDVSDLKLSQYNQEIVNTHIVEIRKEDVQPENEILRWRFHIVSGLGSISFTSSGFSQIVNEQPIFSID